MRSRRASASSSSSPSSCGSGRSRTRCAAGVVAAAPATLLLAGVAPRPALAKVFHSRQEALQLAFPDAERIEKRTFILEPEQVRRIEALAQAPLDSKLVTIFTAYQGDRVLGYANVDVHTVRTHPSALLVVWTPEGVVRSVRILAFHEPLDYLPAEKWYETFVGRSREDRLRVGGDIHGVVGATLSTRVAADSVRRALAYHAVLIQGEGAPDARGAPSSPRSEPESEPETDGES